MNEKEINYLRSLAKAYKVVSDSEANQLKRQRWYDSNDMKKGAKPVFMNHFWQISTKEIVADEDLECVSERGQEFERYMKIRMFYANELGDDNVIEPVIYSKNYFQMEDYKGFGRKIKRSEDDHGNSGAYEMIPVLVEESDIEKIQLPSFEYDTQRSYQSYLEACEIFEPILKVIKEPFTRGSKVADEYSWLRGMEMTYMDMYDRPEWMHQVMRKITDNISERFNLWEAAGLWGTLDLSYPLGSAGLRYKTGMKDYRDVEDAFNHKIKASESWGSTCAEVLNCVSNQMHDEFSYDYDKETTDRFRQISVGCCEVLDKKIELCQKMENATKVSISEWCDHEVAAEAIKHKYVYSYRAAGVPFISEPWDRATSEAEIRSVLESAKRHGCNLEIILNIGGTLGNEPRKKAIEWSQMVRGLIDEYYPVVLTHLT